MRTELDHKRRDKYGEMMRRIMYPPHDIDTQWEAGTIEEVASVLEDYKIDLQDGLTPRVPLHDAPGDEILFPNNDPDYEWSADTIEDFAAMFNDHYKPDDPLDYWEELRYVFQPLPTEANYPLEPSQIDAWRRAIGDIVADYEAQIASDMRIPRDAELDEILRRLKKPDFNFEDDVTEIGKLVEDRKFRPPSRGEWMQAL